VSTETFMWATFCDDVRQEIGNKLSYLGIYGPNLIVPAFPTTLVKLCCVFSVRVPLGNLPKTVIFRLLRDDEVMFEAEVAPTEVLGTANGGSADGSDTMALTLSSIAQLIAFPVTQRCLLRARAIVDGKELPGGTLELLAGEGTST
jgi:hypothetical protein